jgi:bacterioferritin-associated ferredoxin
MQPDDTVCFCFHVSYRKLRNYARQNTPRVPSQMTECLGAGTGCQWCVPIIKKIWSQECGAAAAAAEVLPDEAARKAEREAYWEKKYGRKPKEGERGR